MDKREYLTNLYDEYKDLLTEKQREYFESYYFEDLSLTEIAENNKVTKSLVGKTISQVEEKLEDYENKLKLNFKIKSIEKIIKKINDENLKKELEDILYK